jgi:polyhydroxybutyrate depolymerase
MFGIRSIAIITTAFALAVGCGSSDDGTTNGGNAAGDNGATGGGGDDGGTMNAQSDAGSGSSQSKNAGNGGGNTMSDGSGSGTSGGPPTGSGGSGGAPGTPTRTVDGRPYQLVVPNGYSASSPTPFVLLLHGYAENASTIDSYFGMSALAQKKGFILALPNGNKDQIGLQYWNADDACCDDFGKHPDDVGYLTDIIHDVKSAYNVDIKRVYVAGHSNGGFMSHRMACDHADEIAAAMSLAGMVWKDESKCNPSEPIAVLQVHGDQDGTILYNGGMNPTAAYPSAPTTIATWASKNGCDATLADTGMTLDLESQLPGAETTVARHSCTKGAAELWTIKGGQHIPSFQPTWSETFYGFLESHAKP